MSHSLDRGMSTRLEHNLTDPSISSYNQPHVVHWGCFLLIPTAGPKSCLVAQPTLARHHFFLWPSALPYSREGNPKASSLHARTHEETGRDEQEAHPVSQPRAQHAMWIPSCVEMASAPPHSKVKTSACACPAPCQVQWLGECGRVRLCWEVS